MLDETCFADLKVRLLNAIEVHSAGQAVAINNRKLLALVAIIAVSGQSLLPRDRAVGLLWSETPEAKAKASLRNLIYLQKGLSPKGDVKLFDSQQTALRYLGDPAANDLHDLLDAARRGDAESLSQVSLNDFEMTFLEGLNGVDPALDDWLAETRVALSDRLAELLQAHLTDETAAHESYRVVATRLTELKPGHELANRYLMRLDAAAGNVGEALRRYEALWHLLEDRFDVEPSTATADLAISLKMPEQRPVAVAPASNEPQATIFIRQFATGGIEGAEYFVSGIRAELLNALFAVEEWVIVEPDEGELSVGGSGFFELRGVVAPGLNRVRLILTLKDLATGRIVWNEQIPVEISGWAENSVIAVQRLAALLVETVEIERFEQVRRLEPEELNDYDRVTRARVLMYAWDMEKDREAEALLRGVLDSPRLGIRGRIGLVELLNSRHLVFPGVEEDSGQRNEALELARASVGNGSYRVDSALCLAWAALQAGHAEEAIHAARTVAEASTSNPRRLASAAEVLSLAGQVDEGLEYAKLSERLDLGASRINHGYRVSIFFAAEEFEACCKAAERSGGAIVLGDGYAAAAAAEAGDTTAAQRHWKRLLERLRDHWCGPQPPDCTEAQRWIINASPLLAGPVRDRFETAIRALPGESVL